MKPERVVLVDRGDVPRGTAEKLQAHEEGWLHRAFSVFIVNERGQLLLQRRARRKYHSGGRWSNACCGHPRPGETTGQAAHRRLREEMGFDCPLASAGWFLYHADVGRGLVEHELDHVFVGRWSGEPAPDPAEVDGWRWVSRPRLERELEADPDAFTVWLPLALALLDDEGAAGAAPVRERRIGNVRS